MVDVYTSPLLFQRGRGLGGFLGRLARSVIPFISKRRGLFKKVGKAAARAALHAAEEKILHNRPLSEGLRESGAQELKKLVRQARNTALMKGRGRQQKSPILGAYTVPVRRQPASRKVLAARKRRTGIRRARGGAGVRSRTRDRRQRSSNIFDHYHL